MGIIEFYRECLWRAFSGKFFRIEKWSGGIAMLMLVLSEFVSLPEGVPNFLESVLPLYFFISVFLVTVFVGFVTAPHEIYKEQREAVVALEEEREPKLRVSVPGPSGTREFGSYVDEVGSGKRVTSLRMSTNSGLALHVENLGSRRAGTVTALLVSARRVGEAKEEIQIVEPIKLPWDHIASEENLQASLDPGEKRRVWIADSRGEGWLWLVRDTTKIPYEATEVFGPPGEYEADVLITDGTSLSIETRLRLVSGTSSPTEMWINGISEGSIFMVSQGSPRL